MSDNPFCHYRFLGGILLVICFNFYLQSQELSKGSYSIGRAGCFVNNNDALSAIQNQSGLAKVKATSITLGYDNAFMVKELSNKIMGVVQPVSNKSSIALHFQQFGYKLFYRNYIGLAYGMMLSEKLSAGVELSYIHYKLAEIYGSKGLPSFQAGFQYDLNEKWILGGHVFNPVQSKLASYNNERLSTTLVFGTSWKASKQVLASAEVEKEINSKLNLRFSVDYQILKYVSLRSGFATYPATYAIGTAFQIANGLTIDFASSYHQILGFSPATSITYQFNQKNNDQ